MDENNNENNLNNPSNFTRNLNTNALNNNDNKKYTKNKDNESIDDGISYFDNANPYKNAYIQEDNSSVPYDMSNDDYNYQSTDFNSNDNSTVNGDTSFDVNDNSAINNDNAFDSNDNFEIRNPILSRTLPQQNQNLDVDNSNKTSSFTVDNSDNMPAFGFDNSDNMAPSNDYYVQDFNQSNSVQSSNNLNNDSFIQNNNQEYNTNSNSENYNIEFVQNWMGNLYEKAHSKKFNWCAALFGGLYFLYRKMYSTSILILIFTLLLPVLSVFIMMKNVALGIGLYSLITFGLFFAFGFGFYPLYRNFVRSKLNKYKQSITNNDQLMNIAKQKGGTNIFSVIIYVVIAPIVLSIISGILMTAGILSFAGILSGSKMNSTIQNTVTEPQTDMQDYNFSGNYKITYDANTWYLNDSTKSLIKGDYSLVYANQSIENVSTVFNLDSKTANGRSGILQSITTSFSSQAIAANLQLESGSSNFILQDNCYYAYVDVIEASAINRYYLILLPNEDVIYQFVLSINDTSIDYKTNLSVISMLSSISPVSKNADLEQNITNEISDIENIVSNNSVSNNIDVSNTVDSVLSNNTTNNTISTSNNTVNPSNTLSNTNNSTNLNSLIAQ